MQERERNKTQERILHKTIFHHLLTNAQLVPEQQLTHPNQLLKFIYWAWHPMAWISLWPVQTGSPGYDSSQLLVHLLTGKAWETTKLLAEGKHHLAPTRATALSTFFSYQTQKHSTVPSTKKKINSVPAEIRTAEKNYRAPEEGYQT